MMNANLERGRRNSSKRSKLICNSKNIRKSSTSSKNPISTRTTWTRRSGRLQARSKLISTKCSSKALATLAKKSKTRSLLFWTDFFRCFVELPFNKIYTFDIIVFVIQLNAFDKLAQ